MTSFYFVNLIQASAAAIAALGFILLWRTVSFKSFAVLMLVISFSSVLNIVEQASQVSYLISPALVMLFGPSIYLALKFAVSPSLKWFDWLHLLPVTAALAFSNSHVREVIAVGSVWRLAYSALSVQLLFLYHKQLQAQRSDSDDFSLNWLVWLIIATAGFNLIDLVRLNSQHLIDVQLNLVGQAVNNALWVVVIAIVIAQLTALDDIPKPTPPYNDDDTSSDNADDYQEIFASINQQVTGEQWYLTPRLTLQDITDKTGLNTRDISRAINLVNGNSFNQYINALRVQYVCDTLASDTQTPITTLAFDAGFSSKASFNKVFKQETNLTPSQYRATL